MSSSPSADSRRTRRSTGRRIGSGMAGTSGRREATIHTRRSVRSHEDSAMTRKVSTLTLASGLTLSFAEQGDPSAPALVLLPGPTDSWLSYEPVLERIPLCIRAIAVSPRGHGDSDKPATGYRVEDFAADVPH